MPAVKTHTGDLATRLVDEAGRILAAEGVGALSLRRLATQSGTSTMAVYTLFGDKRGLLAAMHREGFARLGAALAAAVDPGHDALTALAELGAAYRAAALANPHLYNLMFGGAVPGFTPDEAGQQAADATYTPLVAAVQRCLDDGAFAGAAAEDIARHLWAVSHGIVSLELNGQLAGKDIDFEKAYRDGMIYSALPFLKT